MDGQLYFYLPNIPGTAFSFYAMVYAPRWFQPLLRAGSDSEMLLLLSARLFCKVLVP